MVFDKGYSDVSGVKDLSAKMLSIASNSACLVACKGSSIAGKYKRLKSYVAELICAIPCFCDNDTVSDKYTPHRDLGCSQGLLGLLTKKFKFHLK